MVKTRDFALRGALVSYRAIGQEGRETRRSSIWLPGDSGWQIVFHQGTKVQNPFYDRWGVPTGARES